MDPIFKSPPRSKELLTPPGSIADRLSVLIGQPFNLTGKTRTDGSNIRKLIAHTLSSGSLPERAPKDSYSVLPPKGKGVPKILLEYLDTYIVTTGTSYNLQVWNRNPNAESVQIQYDTHNKLISSEVRFVLVKIDTEKRIESIAVLTPDYIVRKFGRFGKPTIKNQLIVSSSARQAILANKCPVLFYEDEHPMASRQNINNIPKFGIHDAPTPTSLLPLSLIKEIFIDKLLGNTIPSASTKNRGQALEGMIASALGYNYTKGDLLAGGYPDIRNQALEVKIQDSPTVDLGLYSPEFEESIHNCDEFTTRNTRYLIVLTNPETYKIEGAVICAGSRLGQHFTYVADKSYKCQRSIPMAFFDSFCGKSVFNP